MSKMITNAKSIFLADDDSDDCAVFEDALNELNDNVRLTVSNDGVELLDTLHETVPPPPYVIFLDINMPRKDGFESLKEIRETEKMKGIPVVILSTSSSQNIIDMAFLLGANYYICKPTSYPMLKQMIGKVLAFDTNELHRKPNREDFVLVA